MIWLVIEDISRKRQAYSSKEAIYFIAPTKSNVESFIADFANGRLNYAAAHLFFTTGLIIVVPGLGYLIMQG